MKQIRNSIRIKIRKNKTSLLFFLGLALIGVLAGSLFFLTLRDSDQILVKDYIESFINTIRDSKLLYLDTLKNACFSNVIYSFLIFVLGISVIGIPIIVLCHFIKSFIIGFSLSIFIYTYGFKGILFSLIYFIPNFFYLIVYTVLCLFAIKISILLNSLIFSKNKVDIKNTSSKYVTYYALVLIFILFNSLIETFLVPFILKKLLFVL